MKKSQKILLKKIQEIVEKPIDSIRKEVAQEVLSHSYDNIEDFFKDLLQYGCVSGMISALIYYADTHKFYDKYYDEIENLRYENEESTGITLQVKGDLKNFFAWFAFEETAYQLAIELGLEV